MIGEIVGQELVDSLAVGPQTSFGTDLELESIELVALADLVQSRWGHDVDLVAWTAEMGVEELMGLTVGRLVDFVVASRA